MTTYTDWYGTVSGEGESVHVSGDKAQLYAWSHRTGNSWPCSYLEDCERVTAVLDARNGDLVDLVVFMPGELRPADSDEVDIPGDELTAWVDDNLAGTKYANLARSTAEPPRCSHF